MLIETFTIRIMATLCLSLVVILNQKLLVTEGNSEATSKARSHKQSHTRLYQVLYVPSLLYSLFGCNPAKTEGLFAGLVCPGRIYSQNLWKWVSPFKYFIAFVFIALCGFQGFAGGNSPIKPPISMICDFGDHNSAVDVVYVGLRVQWELHSTLLTGSFTWINTIGEGCPKISARTSLH